MSGETLVFVYGTSIRGESDHGVLSQARFVKYAKTEAAYDLLDLEAFPALAMGGDTAVQGEVYAVDDRTLAALDRRQGHPHYYERATVRLVGGEEVQAYVVQRKPNMTKRRITSGDWRQRGHGSKIVAEKKTALGNVRDKGSGVLPQGR